eukprot:Amastigsp_a841376_139.p2 type:complete len:139 gc:universal Amastigsp_a841376_139:440-24(-)
MCTATRSLRFLLGSTWCSTLSSSWSSRRRSSGPLLPTLCTPRRFWRTTTSRSWAILSCRWCTDRRCSFIRRCAWFLSGCCSPSPGRTSPALSSRFISREDDRTAHPRSQSLCPAQTRTPLSGQLRHAPASSDQAPSMR